MVVAAMKHLAGVLAVFAVVFAPAAGDIGARNAPGAPDGADLSGAVLAPTFTSGELAIGRSTEDVADDGPDVVVGHRLAAPSVPVDRVDGTVPRHADTAGSTDSSVEAWSSRAPPAS